MQLPLQTEALVVEEPGDDFKMTPIVIDHLRPDEVLVEMKYSGVCHTDFLLQHGLLGLAELPAIAGHEGAGIIRAVGAEVRDKSLRVGDRVLLSYAACGRCEACAEKRASKCAAFAPLNLAATRWPDGSTPARLLDGRRVGSQFFGQSSFARVSAVHERSVVRCPLPDDDDGDMMALYAPMGCGYQTGAGTVLNVLRPRPYQTVAIFGMGSVGFAALMAATSLPVRAVIAVDLVDRKLALARELGATHTINSSGLPQGASVVDEVMGLTGGRGVDFAIDTTGVASVVEKMLDCLAQAGTAASVGATQPGKTIAVDAGAFFTGMKTWVAVAEGDSNPPEFIPQLIDLHKQGKFPIEKISRVYPVAELKTAISDMEAGRVIKAIIQF